MSQRARGSHQQGARRRAGLALLAALTLTAAGCVKPNDAEVAINKVEASLVFGVKPPTPPAPPPSQEAIERISERPELPDDDIFALPMPEVPEFAPLPPKRKSDCEPAPPSASAEVPVEVNVTGDVPVGLYRWQAKAKITAADGTVIGGDVKDFERRLVRNVEKVSDTVYTFEQVQPLFGTDLVAINKIRVNTEPVSRNVDPGYNNIATLPGAGEPERGVVLDSITYQDRNGVTQRTFTPPAGLLMLPLPVTPGEHFVSASVDPKNGQTLVNDMTVSRRGRIDACGTLVDGWLVEGTQTLQEDASSPPQQYGFSYIIALQYGGILINERLTAAGPEGEAVELEFTLGQLKPDPLPAGA